MIKNPIIYKFFKDVVVDMDRAGVVDMANILKWREGRYKGRGERFRNEREGTISFNNNGCNWETIQGMVY